MILPLFFFFVVPIAEVNRIFDTLHEICPDDLLPEMNYLFKPYFVKGIPARARWSAIMHIAEMSCTFDTLHEICPDDDVFNLWWTISTVCFYTHLRGEFMFDMLPETYAGDLLPVMDYFNSIYGPGYYLYMWNSYKVTTNPVKQTMPIKADTVGFVLSSTNTTPICIPV